jgi:hypothetical protein
MWFAGTGPPMGPFPIRQIKAGLAVVILEGLVHRERASLCIELHQEQAILLSR